MDHPKSFLFVTIDGGGNIPPMLGLARRLARRGHHVRVLTEPCLEQVVKGYGLAFVPFTEHFTRTDRTEDLLRDWNATPLNNPPLDHIVFGPARTVVAQTISALEAEPTEVLVADCLLPTALIAAEYLGVANAVVFHFPEYLPGRNRPPGLLGLNPGRGVLGRWRDQLLGVVFHRLLGKYRGLINEVRASYHLPPVARVTDLLHQADRRFIQTLPRFDFPLEPAPANLRYTGPVLDDPDWTAAWESPWPEEDDRPLVVVSLSSTFQNQAATLQQCIDALAGLEVRGLVTVGPAMNPSQFSAPEHIAVVASVPHSAVFPVASVVVTHAGHGTLMRALAHGLPVLCLPMGRDQVDNAAKAACQGCGLRLSPKAEAPKIRRAVARLLSEPAFRERAVAFQDDILDMAQRDLGVDELEALAARGPADDSPRVKGSTLEMGRG